MLNICRYACPDVYVLDSYLTVRTRQLLTYQEVQSNHYQILEDRQTAKRKMAQMRNTLSHRIIYQVQG